jgi:hypothetical protein
MSVTINVTSAGAQPTPPSILRDQLVTAVKAARPGYTDNLPGSMIEDIASTSVGALAIIDQAAVDLLNSLTPQTANAYILGLLGLQAGIQQGVKSNASAYVTFIGLAGFQISKGFVVSDGLHQYTTQDAAVLSNPIPTNFTGSISGDILTVTGITSGQIMVGDAIGGPNVAPGTVVTGPGSGSGGTGTYILNNAQTVLSEAMTGATHGTATVYVVAKNSGSWAIPPNTITTIITSVPTGFTIYCSNANTGLPSTEDETPALYRARVMDANLAPSTGQISYLKTLLRNVPGVQYRLVSASPAGKIIVGGGDPYAVAAAIMRGLFDLGDMIGSSVQSHTWSGTGAINSNLLTLSGVSGGTVQMGDIISGNGVANPTIITGLGTGTGGNGTYLVNYSQIVTSTAINGGNSARNVVVNIVDYPDNYWILFVVPVQQIITIAINWSTIAPNFTANTAINAAVSQALSDYINSIPVAQALNTYSINKIFLEAVAPIIDPALISAITPTITLNGNVVTPSPGTGLIVGDSEGYFITDTTKITLTRA